MKDNHMKNIKVYDDIIKQYRYINSWTDEDCFPISLANDSEKNRLKDINVIEIIFPGGQGNRGKVDETFNIFDYFVTKYILSSTLPIYIFKAEHKKMQKNRIRSYRGVLPKSLNQSDYLQVEFELPNNYSIISGIASLTEDNIRSLSGLILDSTNCFIISTQENIFSTEFIVNMCEKHMKFNGITVINYLSLCLQYCINQNSLCRVGGDGGDQEVTLQIFSAKQQKERILETIRQIL